VGKFEEMAGEFYMLDWTREVDTHEAYIEALDFVIKFYKNNSDFRLDVAKTTAKVLGKDVASSDEGESGKIETNCFLWNETITFLRNFSVGKQVKHLVDY